MRKHVECVLTWLALLIANILASTYMSCGTTWLEGEKMT